VKLFTHLAAQNTKTPAGVSEFWAAPGPQVESIGRALSRLVKRRKGLFQVMGEKMVPLGRYVELVGKCAYSLVYIMYVVTHIVKCCQCNSEIHITHPIWVEIRV